MAITSTIGKSSLYRDIRIRKDETTPKMTPKNQDDAQKRPWLTCSHIATAQWLTCSLIDDSSNGLLARISRRLNGSLARISKTAQMARSLAYSISISISSAQSERVNIMSPKRRNSPVQYRPRSKWAPWWAPWW